MRSVGLRGLFCEILAFFLIANAPAARAQVAGATITGVVKDQAGAAVPGATITVTDVGTNRQRVVTSSREGIYAAAGLTPGVYRVDVELAGFKPLRRTGIQLETGETAQLDIVQEIGDHREQVTVTADAPVLRAATASLGAVVDHEQV